MDKYNEEYRRITKQIINKSFPSLKNHRIFVFEIPYYFWATAVSCPFLLFSLICPTRKARRHSKLAIKGFLAHELCHIEINNKKSILKLLKEEIMYYLSLKAYYKIERETELLVIKKGYGKELFTMSREIEEIRTKKELEKRYKRGYLSPAEIKRYMKKQ